MLARRTPTAAESQEAKPTENQGERKGKKKNPKKPQPFRLKCNVCSALPDICRLLSPRKPDTVKWAKGAAVPSRGGGGDTRPLRALPLLQPGPAAPGTGAG